MTAPALHAEGVSAWFEGLQALADVTLTCGAGQITALVGPTDSGKSALLRMFNRMAEEEPGFRCDGRILLGSEDVAAIPREQLRRRVGMVFAKPAPFRMSLFKNVVFGLEVAGRGTWRERGDKAEEVLRRVGLWEDVHDRLTASPGDLSIGQQQLLCLARTLALDPEVLVFDEPTESLDPVEAGRLEAALYDLREDHTVVLATQDIRLAGRVSDVAGYMESGRLIEVGATEDLFTRPRAKATEAYLTRRY